VSRSLIKSFFKWLAVLLLIGMLAATIFAYRFLQELEKDLPDIKQLENVQYQIPLNVYSKEGLLIARFGEKKRIPIDIKQTPERLIQAFLAAEDDRFYEHPGVDYQGLLRAALQLALTGKKKQGGSTITMQVTRNFLLSREKTYIRKLKEILLALKIEKAYSKDKILELYLNKIYLGHRAYGVAAAAQTYYGKNLNDLTLAQTAMIAGLPKAPSAYNPVTNPERALQRRNYVLGRMLKLGYIDQSTYNTALKEPVSAALAASQKKSIELQAPYVAEMVRKYMVDRYGDDAYTQGFKVYTTVTQKLQTAATRALRNTLHAYDERHGYRSLPHKNIGESRNFNAERVGATEQAKIIALTDKTATALLSDGQIVELPWENIKWARRFKSRYYLGPELKTTADIFKVNDLIRVRQLNDGHWALAQIPEVQGAFVSLKPKDGGLLALVGGYDFYYNKFNHATQSKRQPGSGFKPIIYTTALEHGFTAASVINDAPIIMDDNGSDADWRPENYSRKFYGPTPLRVGLRKSRNLISIRLVKAVGIEEVIKTAQRFGFSPEQVPHSLSLALGSGYATPMQMARMFATFANGGFLIDPYFIDKIEDHDGNTLFQAIPAIACSNNCPANENQRSALRILSPQVNFIMNSLLRDVVRRGTATKAKVLGRNDLAGKTGTTNDQRDAWFNGFTPDIVATAWVGLDDSKPLGRAEVGGRAALPMWIDFMRTALADHPEKALLPPPGLIRVRVDPETGLRALSNMPGTWEYFRSRYAPRDYAPAPETESVENMEDELF
jgi:penicillin-binding protein 1A